MEKTCATCRHKPGMASPYGERPVCAKCSKFSFGTDGPTMWEPKPGFWVGLGNNMDEINSIIKQAEQQKALKQAMSLSEPDPTMPADPAETVWHRIARQVADLVADKNAAYGDSFAQAHRIVEVLYPDGIKPSQYRDALAVTRIIDKLLRIATNKDAFDESPWRDVTGYGLLATAADEKDKEPQLF